MDYRIKDIIHAITNQCSGLHLEVMKQSEDVALIEVFESKGSIFTVTIAREDYQNV